MPIQERFLTTTILLAACGGQKLPEADPPPGSAVPPAASAAAPSVLLLCGADTVSVQGTGDELKLHVQGETFLVRRTASASGAKYQVEGDSTTFFWNHGTRARVQVRGDLMPECETVPGM